MISRNIKVFYINSIAPRSFPRWVGFYNATTFLFLTTQMPHYVNPVEIRDMKNISENKYDPKSSLIISV